eukprot:360674-Chlamydomonas_euryale.AAC.3
MNAPRHPAERLAAPQLLTEMTRVAVRRSVCRPRHGCARNFQPTPRLREESSGLSLHAAAHAHERAFMGCCCPLLHAAATPASQGELLHAAGATAARAATGCCRAWSWSDADRCRLKSALVRLATLRTHPSKRQPTARPACPTLPPKNLPQIPPQLIAYQPSLLPPSPPLRLARSHGWGSHLWRCRRQRRSSPHAPLPWLQALWA